MLTRLQPDSHPSHWLALTCQVFESPIKCLKCKLVVMGASFTTVTLPSWITLQSAVPFLMLQIGMSMAYKSKGILKVLCKVWPPVNNVAAIPLDVVANAILPFN